MNDTRPRRNGALWLGWLFALLTIVTGFLFFTQPSWQPVLPWFNLALSALALIAFFAGLRRAYTHPGIYRGKISASIFTGIAFVLFAFTVFGFYVSRNIPSADAAPRVGQKAPTFNLTDSHGQSVSLAQLLTPADPAAKPRAVLLIFYRGYW